MDVLYIPPHRTVTNMDRSKLTTHRRYLTEKGAPNGCVEFDRGAFENTSGACDIIL